MYRRQKPGRFHAYPEHEPMWPLGWWHRLLWRAGFDPLSDGRRVKQLQAERDNWKRWLEESEAARQRRLGDEKAYCRACEEGTPHTIACPLAAPIDHSDLYR